MFLVYLRYLAYRGKLDQVQWDVSTITAADYTVEMKIDSEEFKNWKRGYEQNSKMF
jgi:hypothetical protein